MGRSGLARLSFYVASFCSLVVYTTAQEHSCRNSTIISVPSRPTVSNSTDTTQCGVVELEYGLERQWPGGGADRDDLSGGLRFGITPNLDFHWQSGAFLRLKDANDDRTSFGDTWLGLKYRFLSQGKRHPSVGLFYQAKVPSASASLGLGTGEVDHAISFLFSKDFSPVHLDFNVVPLLAGRPGTEGHDHNFGFALSASAPLTRKLGIVGEGYGYSLLNQDNPSFAATMVGLTYQVRQRLVLDGGMDVGVTHCAPHKRVFIGITFAIANMYALRQE